MDGVVREIKGLVMEEGGVLYPCGGRVGAI